MLDINELSVLCRKLKCRIDTECPLKEYVTFRFGGPCRALISINSAESASQIIKYVRNNGIKYGILGRGSNIIPLDEGFDGVLLLFGKDFSNISISGSTVKCDSGALLASVCVHSQQAGLSGMENLFGIPGTAGGALYMNAGAYNSEMKDIVTSAEYIDENGDIRSIGRDDMELSYRHSIFSDKNYVITSVTMELSQGNSDEIRTAMSECMAKRSAKQPLEYASAGSTFKRPEGNYASRLIEQCGLKGLTVGGAMVSEKHSGFIINKGFATCSDVLELCRQVQETVKDKTGYNLELEPIVLR